MMNTPTLPREQSATSVSEKTEKSRPLSENRVLLHGVSWETFECLLAYVGDRRKTLFNYIKGNLEIMSPLSLHEGSSRFFDKLLTIFVDELDIDMRCLGSLLMKSSELKIGGEPDSCYYIKNELAIRAQENVIVGQDPPPDLVLEVDITNPSDRRLQIYALLGVPEVWRYDGYSLEFLALQNGGYVAIENSLSFPTLPAAIIVEYVQKRLLLGESKTLKEFRGWVKAIARGLT